MEPMLQSYIPGDRVIVAEMPFLVFISREEIRGSNGLLRNPPLLFLVRYDPEQADTAIYPLVDWNIAAAIDNEALDRLDKKMSAVRGTLYAEWHKKNIEPLPAERQHPAAKRDLSTD